MGGMLLLNLSLALLIPHDGDAPGQRASWDSHQSSVAPASREGRGSEVTVSGGTQDNHLERFSESEGWLSKQCR
jgi:hypothetical protein